MGDYLTFLNHKSVKVTQRWIVLDKLLLLPRNQLLYLLDIINGNLVAVIG